MNFKNNNYPGTFNWADLAASSAVEAKAYYGRLFGWKAQDVPVGPGVFTMLYSNDTEVASLYQLDPQQSAQGIPAHWMAYVAVANADKTSRRVQQLGGQVLVAPFDILNAGRIALLLDPTGAPFAIWQTKRRTGQRRAWQPGMLAWTELLTADRVRAATFYMQLFGWQINNDGDGSWVFSRNGRLQAGMKRPSPQSEAILPHWRVYFAVPDIQSSVVTALASGGTILTPPGPSLIGSQALLQDPQGAVFGLITLTRPTKKRNGKRLAKRIIDAS